MAEQQARFIREQYRFAAHIRDPQHNPAPAGVEDRRMAIYRDLFFNNVVEFLASGFPVLREIYTEEGWRALVRDYFASHHAHTPLFTQMSKEFVEYLQSERAAQAGDPPYLSELAHYEWVEMALTIDPRELEYNRMDPEADLLACRPLLSPLAWPLSYRFPVHTIGPDNQPMEAPAGNTFLLIYRDRHDEVGFTEMNPVTARLVELLMADDDRNGRQLLEQIAEELKHPDPAVVVEGGLAILEDLRQRDVIPGVA